MQVVYERCGGLDVHKKTVVACVIVPGADGQPQKETKTFETMTENLTELADWLQAQQVTCVAMASTGVYWKPVYNLLDGRFEILVVNAEHVKALQGRKTDVADAEWLADLLQHGLLKGSFIPSAQRRELRDLTRYRTKLGDDRKSEINRLHKVLEDAHRKRTSVVTDGMGVSAQAILAELVKGNTDAALLADLAQGRLREKQEKLQKALQGNRKAHHRFMLAQPLSHLEFLDEASAKLDAQIAEWRRPFEAERAAWDSLPGINQRIAEIILAEVGADLEPFADAQQLASWAGMCPGNDQSGGKRKNAKTRKGSKWLRRALVEAAHGAARKKKSYYKELYHRIAARRGKQRAAVAVGHSLLVTGYYLITRHQTYQDVGDNYFDARDREHVKRRAVKRLEKLGFHVELKPATA